MTSYYWFFFSKKVQFRVEVTLQSNFQDFLCEDDGISNENFAQTLLQVLQRLQDASFGNAVYYGVSLFAVSESC